VLQVRSFGLRGRQEGQNENNGKSKKAGADAHAPMTPWKRHGYKQYVPWFRDNVRRIAGETTNAKPPNAKEAPNPIHS
jgi:hypothetical protein